MHQINLDFNCLFDFQKGIVTNVMLDNEVLTGWTHYLTKNFVPDFQNNNLHSILEQYKRPEYALTQRKKT